jgi:hypothetical protein
MAADGGVVIVDPNDYPVDDDSFIRSHGKFIRDIIVHLFGDPPDGNGSLSYLKSYIKDMFVMYKQSPSGSQPIEYDMFLKFIMEFIKTEDEGAARGGRKKQRRSVIKKRKSMSKKRKNGRKSNKKQRIR